MELPLDILQEIALWSLPNEPAGSINETPICFSHVCASWRQSALSMPQIWSRLCVKLKCTLPDSPALGKNLQLRLVHFFANAKGQPLSLHLTFHTKWSQEVQQTVHVVRDFVNWMFYIWPLMPDIRNLTILSMYPWNEIVDEIKPPHLPLLETLVLSNHPKGRHIAAENNRWMAQFHDAPRLRHLTADHSMLKNPGTDLIPWSQLEEIYLANPIPAQLWIAIIDICSQLRSGFFHVSGALSIEPQTYEPHRDIQDRCPNLHKLTITFRGGHPDSLNILQHRRLPNLTHLGFRFRGESDRDERTDIYYLEPYLPKLTKLEIHRAGNFPISFRSFFSQSFPLTHLSLWIDESHTKTLWPILTISDSDSRPLLPLLSSIKVAIPRWGEFRQGLREYNALDAMLRSRTIPNHKFNISKLLHFQMTCEIKKRVETRLEEIQERFTQLGVDVVIENASGLHSLDPLPPGHSDTYYIDASDNVD